MVQLKHNEPAYLPRTVSVIVLVCVYIPPNCKNSIQYKLFKSLTSLFENLRGKYVSPGFVLMGDFNKWKYSHGFSNTVNFEQIIDSPTFIQENRNTNSKLDLIFTNIFDWYNKPKALGPLKNSATHHVCIELKPRETIQMQNMQKNIFNYRIYSKDNLLAFANLIEEINWQPFYDSNCINFKVDYMNVLMNNAFQLAFPEISKEVKPNDNLWVTNSLSLQIKSFKKLSKHDDNYNKIKKLVSKEIKFAKEAFKSKLQSELRNKPLSLHSVVNKLCSLKPKILPVEKIALSEQINMHSALNQINEHFAAICNRYDPIKCLNTTNVNSAKSLCVNEFQVLRSFENLNTSKSNVPGSLPAKFLKFAAVHIVPHYTHIINFSFQKMTVPSEWKKGYITPVPKEINSITIDSLRPITQTNIYSKIMEGFMLNKIYRQVLNKLNKNQYGALRKSSTAYYLISLFNFVYTALEKPNTHVILVLLDLSKAFDLVDYNVLIKRLIEIGICENDVLWVADFLRNRTQCTKHLNSLSNFLPITNSTPQGTKLAVLLFVVLINDLLTDFYAKHESPNNILNAFVDDMCIAEAVSNDQPAKINELVNDLNERMSQNKMVLNAKKSMVLVINNSKKKNRSIVNVTINGEALPRTTTSKLLGVLINTKADWNEHVDYIYSKACKKVFILRKLKCFGFSKTQLVSIYVLHIRSLLEYCSVLWSSALSLSQNKKLVSVEKRALSIIAGVYVSNRNYLAVCKTLNLIDLNQRWIQLLGNFGLQTLSNDKHKHWLDSYKIIRKPGHSSRNHKNKYNFRAVRTRSERYRKSTIPALIRLLREKFF